LNLVYQIIFPNRKEQNKLPYQYIGSKSNGNFNGKDIIDKNGKPYLGSSRDKNYRNVIKSKEPYEIIILYQADCSYEDILIKEREYHLLNDVVVNPTFFNKGIAMVNTYSDPTYATMKHVETGKIARIPRDTPSIKTGEWVGVTSGIPQSEEYKIRNAAKFREMKSFLGKKHTDEVKAKLSKLRIEYNKTEQGKLEIEKSKERASKRFKGVPKSPEHRAKIGRKGFKQVKNIKTGEIRRITITENLGTDWVNPTLLKPVYATCSKCGITSIKGNIIRWHNEKCEPRKYKKKENYENQTN